MEAKLSGAIEKAKAGIFYIDDLTAEQRLALTQKCNDAYARALLRRLRAAIQFAQAEPDTRPVYERTRVSSALSRIITADSPSAPSWNRNGVPDLLVDP